MHTYSLFQRTSVCLAITLTAVLLMSRVACTDGAAAKPAEAAKAASAPATPAAAAAPRPLLPHQRRPLPPSLLPQRRHPRLLRHRFRQPRRRPSLRQRRNQSRCPRPHPPLLPRPQPRRSVRSLRRRPPPPRLPSRICVFSFASSGGRTCCYGSRVAGKSVVGDGSPAARHLQLLGHA